MTTTLTAPLDTLDALALPTATVRLTDGTRTCRVTVPAEPIGQHLAITGTLHLDDLGPRLGDGHHITHLPTGWYIGPAACLDCCRTAARQLAQLDIDWDTTEVQAVTDRLPTEAKTAVVAQLGQCGLESCDDTNPY